MNGLPADSSRSFPLTIASPPSSPTPRHVEALSRRTSITAETTHIRAGAHMPSRRQIFHRYPMMYWPILSRYDIFRVDGVARRSVSTRSSPSVSRIPTPIPPRPRKHPDDGAAHWRTAARCTSPCVHPDGARRRGRLRHPLPFSSSRPACDRPHPCIRRSSCTN